MTNCESSFSFIIILFLSIEIAINFLSIRYEIVVFDHLIMYFRLRIGLANSIDAYSRLKVRFKWG